VNPATGAVTGLAITGVIASSPITSPAAREIAIADIPTSVGKLSAVTFSNWNETSKAWEPFNLIRDRTRVNMPGTKAIAIESGGKVVRRSAVRAMTRKLDKFVILPAVVADLKLSNLFDSAFGGLSVKGTTNPVNASKGPVNIKVDLTFV
jgi:hypothetical protein